MGEKTMPSCAAAESENRTYEGFPMDGDARCVPKKLLLHSCCGPCSTACIERLKEDYDITVFFYNPNITDREEYEKRKDAQIDFINRYNLDVPVEKQIKFIEGRWEPDVFLEAVKGLENEKEGGARCTVCFELRLSKTAEEAAKGGFTHFGTTLTVSPHKNYPLISAIGNNIERESGIAFLDVDFKKKAGFQRSIELSKEYGLYRQNYCGCSFSKWY